MTDKEIYKIWAPTGAKWVDWVRPVPFMSLPENTVLYGASAGFLPLSDLPGIREAGMAIIVDLPGTFSVQQGIELARMGYRPIPIFNGTFPQEGARATVDNGSVAMALHRYASELAQIEISENAMPVFLLDSNLLHRYKMEIGLFDTIWDVYPQDVPSPEYLWDNGVRKILVIGAELSKDLKKLLYTFQKKGIDILWTKGYEEPQKQRIARPLFKDRN